ncbi:MAG: glutamate racemase [Defluviitaleaceae bacterium]|nr:glutamate racemase [Defluviitaleaceae bacterium]
MDQPIGIFDSGVGGLTVLTEIKKILPKESIIYVGDTANAPYGGKAPDELLKHGRDIINFLVSKNVKTVVLACGTTSSTVYKELSAEFPDIPLIDVIRPGARACIEMKPKRLGLIATAATIKSGLFQSLLSEENLLTQACPMFAPMVESGITHGHIAQWATETYIGHWKGKIDALVLGCTHYPLLATTIAKVLGEDIEFINLAAYTANALKLTLTTADTINKADATATYEYYVSGEPASFNKTARILLNDDINASQMIAYGQSIGAY